MTEKTQNSHMLVFVTSENILTVLPNNSTLGRYLKKCTHMLISTHESGCSYTLFIVSVTGNNRNIHQ